MYWTGYTSRGWDPFTEMRALQREMNRLLDGASLAGDYPALNIWANEDEAVVKAEVPGVDPAKLDIRVLRNQLTIEGERTADAPTEDVVCHRAERGSGHFVRTVRLPFEVEADKVGAAYNRGVLTVTLPRSAATKPKRIDIATA
jgi:HSP20 family protein